MKQLLLLFILHFTLSLNLPGANISLIAQETTEHQHSEEASEEQHRKEGSGEETQTAEHSKEEEGDEITYEGTFAPFKKFPNLHPLFVHIPVVLIPIALLFQIFAFFWYKKAMSIVMLILLSIGAAGGLLAAFWFHPNVGELSGQVQEVLSTHEKFAYWSLGLAGGALLLKLIIFFFSSRNRIFEVVVLLLLASATYTISAAGHLGSQLVYIEGVGPKGNNLKDSSGGGHSH